MKKISIYFEIDPYEKETLVHSTITTESMQDYSNFKINTLKEDISTYSWDVLMLDGIKSQIIELQKHLLFLEKEHRKYRGNK